MGFGDVGPLNMIRYKRDSVNGTYGLRDASFNISIVKVDRQGVVLRNKGACTEGENLSVYFGLSPNGSRLTVYYHFWCGEPSP